MPHRLHPPGFLLAACAAIAMLSLTLGTIGPLLPRFDAAMHSGVYTGLVIAAHPLGSLTAALPTLLLSRRLGLPRVIAVGASIGFAASILFVWPGSGWWIVIARFGYGVSATVVWQSVFAWAITNTGPGRRARTMGTLMAAGTAGGLAAPQVGALASRYGLWLCAVPAALLLLAASRFVLMPAYELLARPDLGRLRATVLSAEGRGGALLTAASAIVALGVSVALPLRLHDEGVGAFGIGAVLTLAAASMIAINPLAGRALDLGHSRSLLVGAFALLTLALGGFALAPSPAVAIPLAYVCTVLPWIPNLAGATLSSRAFSRAEVDQTVSQTLTTLAWAPAAVLGSLGAGAIHSPAAALLTLAAGAALAATGLALERAHHGRPLPV